MNLLKYFNGMNIIPYSERKDVEFEKYKNFVDLYFCLQAKKFFFLFS